jgi:3-methylcrotonyl-CoA carboxylase alpha subunit
MAQVTYQTGQGTVKITLERKVDGTVMATVGEHSYDLSASPTADGGWLLEHGDRRVQVYTASDGMRRFAQMAGGPVYALSVAEPSARRRSGAAANEGRLTAQMPGQVIDVLVQSGEAVSAGQPLVILEAMKMEIRVAAPSDGTVREIFIQKGETVERDQQLLALE